MRSPVELRTCENDRTRVCGVICLANAIDDRLRIVLTGRNRDDVERDAEPADDVVPAHASARMLLVGREHTIAGPPGQAERDPVHAFGRAIGEDQFICLATDECGRSRADIVHHRFIHRIRVEGRVEFELLPRRDRPFDHDAWSRPERSGLQIDEPGFEPEVTGTGFKTAAWRQTGERKRAERGEKRSACVRIQRAHGAHLGRYVTLVAQRSVFMKHVAVIVGVVVSLVIGTVRAAEDFTGKWSGTFVGTGPDGSVHEDTILLNLTQKGTVLTGTAGPNAEQQFPVSNGTAVGTKLVFDVQSDGPLLKFTLTFADGHLKGDAAADFMGQKLSAKVDAQRKTGF